MDKTLKTLCDTLKKLINQLKPQTNPLSLLLLVGKAKQGKTVLLKQSRLQHHLFEDDNLVQLFYNEHGIIIELSENWLNKSENLLAVSMKQINRCHAAVKISGLFLCIDSAELLRAEPYQLQEICQSHTHLLNRFARALGYKTDCAILCSKLDLLAGFSEFFQSEHTHDLQKPLGFSLLNRDDRAKFLSHYMTQFDHMVEVLGQQIIHKLHPARSTVKRTLIREFPLQLSCLRIALQTVLQQIDAGLQIRALYFTSAEQGGVSIDCLNKKIQHEYALTVQDQFPQSSNFRAYFIDGALKIFQLQCQCPIPTASKHHQLLAVSALCISVCLVGGVFYQHRQTSGLLDDASKELLAFEAINPREEKTTALYHLTQAEQKLKLIPMSVFPHPGIKQLQRQLHDSTQQKLQLAFMPDLISILETTIANPRLPQNTRYQALKTYLMLGESEHFSAQDIVEWFNHYWQQQKENLHLETQITLLQDALKAPFQPIVLNQQIVLDARNYLNALPAPYLFFSLAKEHFSQAQMPVEVAGFDLPIQSIPVYFTKTGYQQVMQQLPQIATQLQQENWVLARQDLENLTSQLEEAYHYDYANWWQQFARNTKLQHYQTYHQARHLAQALYQKQSMKRLITLLQQNTGPDDTPNATGFNQKIANQFTGLNLLSESTTQDLSQTINELDKFLTTLALVSDGHQTVFDITKSRFQGLVLSDPLSVLYSKVRQLPEPVSTWTKQLADDTWYILINEARSYLNQRWQKQIFEPYQRTLAMRYPFDPERKEEVTLADFDRFFAPNGELHQFFNQYLAPFLDTTQPQWRPKEVNGYVLPINATLIDELIRANVISNMFFAHDAGHSRIQFSLQKINLDPMVATLELTLGENTLQDNQNSDTFNTFSWPETNAKLLLHSIDGNNYELNETGIWAFFKMLQKVNVIVDNNDSASLQILFEINGNSGRYLLKTENQINPFSPGILTGFNLQRKIA